MEQRHLPTHPPPVLPKPPRLQCENTVIFTKPSPNDVPASLRQHQHQLQLVRKQSFDQLIYRAQYRGRTLERKYSHGSLMHQIQREYGTGSTKAKDDPFFVAVQVCRKQPIESHYHEKAALMKDYSEQGVARGHIRHGSLETQRDSKHPTIRQLFVRQLEEEQEELFLRKAERQALHQRRPLSEKKHQRGAPTFIARCLGC
ncbi:hypothetical protein KP509_11G076800 [Ceratopteris richardii]|nr:hypothetical protein KP509_11G076800 [Ceratopteris richardii]